ncbi:MAG: TrkA family potassium uptake protein [Acidimicrobiales bacterium]
MAERRTPRRRRFFHEPTDLWRPLRLAGATVGLILVAGTAGYVVLGLGWLDALYQTTITISTVGYREIGEVDTAFKYFTIALILLGAGSMLYTVGVLVETLVQGRLTKEFGKQRMQHMIEGLEGHTIVCGWGQVGQAISASLHLEGSAVVVIDRNLETVVEDYPVVLGDATNDDVLSRAGITRAAALVAALDGAADNVYVTLSARATNPDLFIVARANSRSAEPKLHQAGADRVVNPHALGGAHMAALVTQPHVAEFLDIAMTDRELAVRINEITVRDGSPMAERSLGDCEFAGTTILAVREGSGAFVHHPAPSTTLHPGDVLIALGTAEEQAKLRDLSSL